MADSRQQQAVDWTADTHSIEHLFDASPVPMVVTSPNRDGLLAFNARAREMFKLTDPDASTKPVGSFYVNPEDRGPLLATVQRDGRIDDVRVHLRCADGTPIWVVTSG